MDVDADTLAQLGAALGMDAAALLAPPVSIADMLRVAAALARTA